MKTCDNRWRDELIDHALGGPARAALAEHLAGCAVCSAALRRSRARMEKIDAGVRQLAASEPSPEAVSNLMAHIRAQRERTWLWGWQWRTAALCGFAIVIVFLVYGWKIHEQRRESEKIFNAASAIGSWRSPTDSLLRSPTDGWLNASPRLGEYFYPLDTNVPEKNGGNR